ncbi:MAG: YdiU family protein [Polyangiales bacterium]
MGSPSFDNTYTQLPPLFYAETVPDPSPSPKLVRLNEELALELGLDVDWLRSEEGLAMFAGTAVPEGAASVAMAYAGHQFGGYSPRLGDGRAYLLGEVVAGDTRFDIHMKGSGPTAFSRRGDGKATLSSVLREFIVSEAMHKLGVPTSRALAATTTGERIRRETAAAGAVFARVAQSHVRVGTFQFARVNGEDDAVKALADYVIARHYPSAANETNPYRALLLHVIGRQAELVARWMSLGFIHGVMNTDNVQVAGETIDYGPCAFVDVFHPQKVFSSIDQHGRYAWGNQPAIAQWNLTRFAETLLSVLGSSQEEAIAWAEEALNGFRGRFTEAFMARFRDKLGLGVSEDSDALINDTLTLLGEEEVDFTLFFRELSRAAAGDDVALERLNALVGNTERLDVWMKRWRELADPDAATTMKRSNPAFIPRNHRVEEALAAANDGDFEPFELLMKVLARPFDEQPEHAEFERAPAAEEVVTATFCGT